MKKNTYTQNLNQTLIKASRKAFLYGDGKAWDNRKAKICRRHMPRGKAYRRMVNMDWKRACEGFGRLVEKVAQLEQESKKRGEVK